MELEQQFVIPTASRVKISQKLSYPVGAESISVALASVPQLAEIRLHFYLWSDYDLRRGHYEFLRVEYLNNTHPPQEYPIWSLYKRPAQGRWEIVVQPVPRALRHRVKKYIAASALAQIAQWLTERREMTQRGGDILAFFYDEKSEDFAVRQLTRLEPLR
jgi:hypothetical protein